jgi:hypothetical protein
MSTTIRLLKMNTAHTAPHGEVRCNQKFTVESSSLGSEARAFCGTCGKEVVIMGNKVVGSNQLGCG